MIEEREGTSRQERGERPALVLVLGAAFLVLGVLAFPLVAGKMYVHNDIEFYHLPIHHFYQECLKAGHSPVWMPHIMCGYFLHGEGQVGMYHPLHYLLYRFLPLDAAFNIEFYWGYPAMLAGMYFLLRRWRLNRAAALFGACTFAFSGFTLLHAVHVQAIEIIAHTPWLLLACQGVVEGKTSRTRWLSVAGLALLTGSQVLLGYPQYVYLSCLAESMMCLLLLGRKARLDRWPSALNAAALLVGAKVLGLLVGAVQLLPTLDLLQHSARAATTSEFRYIFSMHPANLVQLIGPCFFQQYLGMNLDAKQPQEMGLYNGVFQTLLLVWIITRLVQGRTRGVNGSIAPVWAGEERKPLKALAWLGLALVFIGTVLALGKYGGLYRIVAHLPLLNAFKCPSRHIVIIHLGMAITSAVALADLFHVSRKSVPIRSLWPLALPVAVGWLVAMDILASQRGLPGTYVPAAAGPYLTSWKEILVSPIAMTLAAGVLVAALRGRRAALLALLALSIADQGGYGLRYVRSAPPITLAAYEESIPGGPEGGGRVYAYVNNLLAMKGVENCSGYVAAAPSQRLTYDLWHPNALRAAGCTYTNDAWPKRGEPITWKPVPDPVPVVRFATEAVVSEDPEADIESIDLRKAALVDGAVEIASGEPGKAVIETRQPGKTIVSTQAEGRQLLTIADSHHPGWCAWVDGEEVDVMRVNGDFMGCEVPPGEHTVTFAFDPKSLRLGKWGSLAGIVLTLAIALWGLRVRRA